MNTANLQLEGLCLAIAAINRQLVAKGLLTRQDVDRALHEAEAATTADERFAEHLSPANRDAVCFPIRILRVANNSQADHGATFTHLAKTVGATKQPYNDQR